VVRLEAMTPPPHRSAMNDEDELLPETKTFLANLSREDIATLETGLPLIRMVIGFGKVTKWIAITSLGLLMGTVLLWETVLKILMWVRGNG
jgi:hypothetical protein